MWEMCALQLRQRAIKVYRTQMIANRYSNLPMFTGNPIRGNDIETDSISVPLLIDQIIQNKDLVACEKAKVK